MSAKAKKGPEKTAILKVERMALADLADHPKNPRKHPGEEDALWQSIAKSMQKTYADPLVFNVRNGQLVSGHLRKKVLVSQMFTHADVSVVDLDENEHVELMIALNNHFGSSWDIPSLSEHLDLLASIGSDLALTGFTADELSGFMNPEDDATDPGGDDASSKLGELAFQVIVTCRDEEHQSEVISQLEAEGLTCRPLIL